MNPIIEKAKNAKKAVDLLWTASPAVARWCRMCTTAKDFLLIAAQTKDANIQEGATFRKIIGYLSVPPKRVPNGYCLDDEEWASVNYYTQQEVLDMTAEFCEFGCRLKEWAMVCDADESEEDDFPASAWQFVSSPVAMRIFKDNDGRKMFRSRWLKPLIAKMPRAPLYPKLDRRFIDEMKSTGAGKSDVIVQKLAEIARNTSVLAQDVLADEPGLSRVGTGGEIRQEDEVLRRYNANGRKGLRGLVAQVLRQHDWQFRDGHPNEEKGLNRCYSRVYEILHPGRRRTKK